MAKRGDAAREAVKDTIIKAFGSDFVCVQDKKIYVNAHDGPNGEVLQFAISMTMPKTPIAGSADPSSPVVMTTEARTELSQEDKAKVEELKKRLGII